MLQYHKELARALFSFPPPKNVVLKEHQIYFSLDGVVRRALCGLIFSTGAGPVLIARASVAVAEVQRVSFWFVCVLSSFSEYLQHKSPLPP